MVDLSAVQNVKGFGMKFITDRLLIRTGCGDQEEQGLLPGITGAFGQDIVELAVGLGMYFGQHKARNVQAVLGVMGDQAVCHMRLVSSHLKGNCLLIFYSSHRNHLV